MAEDLEPVPGESGTGEADEGEAAAGVPAAAPEGSPVPLSPGAASATPTAAPGVSYYDRTFTAGMTGSGKSELINVQFSRVRCQRLLLDTKDEFSIRGIEPVSDPAAIDWRHQTIHYVPLGGLDEMEDLFAACYAQRNLVVAAHEGADLCEFHPSAAPRSVRSYLNKGRARGLGLLGGSQQTVNVPTHMRTEAMHVYAFVPRLDPQHHKALAETMGRDAGELAAILDQLHDQVGDHAFIWWNRRTREIVEYPPLPDHVRKTSIVRRRELA